MATTVHKRRPRSEAQQGVDLDRKPLMTFWNILLMNFGFFGIQYSFGLQ